MAPTFNAPAHEALAFGDFQLVPAERVLLRGGRPVKVGSRSLDILIALVARRSEVLSKDALIAEVWPDTLVEESALRVHISTLRKALGDGEGGVRLIANVPGRGYCFVAQVTELTVGTASVEVSTASASAMPLLAKMPALVAKIVGRDELIADLVQTLQEQRLVTVVGPGGMGKTTVALGVAHRFAASGQAVGFVDLASVADPDLVASAVASALGLPVRSSDLIQEVGAAIRARPLLLVLDSCEHVIDTAAAVAETLLSLAPDLRLLATSREALRTEGEWVHRLQPLALPASDAVTAEEALRYPAVQLFVSRASSVLGGYKLDDAHAPVVTEICRRLDGIALAIELATGRLDSMSLQALAKSLENRFQVLTRGRRTALARHQTLRGAIDWSFSILPEGEQALLRRLAVFNGPFTPDAADKVAGDGDQGVEDGLLNLVAKSMLNADVDSGERRYRLLETMRAYAAEKLEAADEGAEWRRRHAAFYRDRLAGAEAEWSLRGPADLLDATGLLGNIRAALDWCFSDEGDPAVGVVLTADAVPLWFQLSLVDECLARVQAALAWLETTPDPDPRVRMRLYASLGFPQMRAITGFPSGVEAWRSTLEIAEAIGDLDYQARALWALWIDRVNEGEAREAMAFANRLAELAEAAANPTDQLIARRVRAWSLLMLGEIEPAITGITTMLKAYGSNPRRSDMARFQYDQRSTARITLARALWLRGDADQALREVTDNIAAMTAADHTLSLAHVLSDAACFVALWRGDLDLAERFTALLRQHTSAQALDVWHTYGDCFEGELRIRRGDTAAGQKLLRSGIVELEAARFICYHNAFQGVLADSLMRGGETHEAAAIVDAALHRSERTGEGWCRPEMLRIRGELFLRLDRHDEAKASMVAAVDLASSHGSLAWELRATISLVRMQAAADRDGARGRLAAVFGRFKEGFDTEDLIAAASLLAELGG